jgi:hypothetical protein
MKKNTLNFFAFTQTGQRKVFIVAIQCILLILLFAAVSCEEPNKLNILPTTAKKNSEWKCIPDPNSTLTITFYPAKNRIKMNTIPENITQDYLLTNNKIKDYKMDANKMYIKGINDAEVIEGHFFYMTMLTPDMLYREYGGSTIASAIRTYIFIKQ